MEASVVQWERGSTDFRPPSVPRLSAAVLLHYACLTGVGSERGGAEALVREKR